MNRRTLLKSLSAGLMLPLGLTPLQALMAANAAGQGRRLILIELTGANDGLNTLVPMTNDHYHRLRPAIGLGKKDVIDLNDEFALHRSLQPLMRLWDRGELAWVQGLGYPKPNRSHFKSIALWESGGDGLKEGRSGWLTHDIEHRIGRAVTDAHGISLKGDLSLFRSDSGRWMSLASTSQIESNSVPEPSAGKQYNTTLDLVAGKMHELHHTMDSLSGKLRKTPKMKAVSSGALGDQLTQVMRLIRSGVDTPVYRVQLGSFDTHDNQLGRHARLLRELAQAIAGFRKALTDDGEWDNTLIMTYSEFGRRAAENNAGGTDHGTAAPHLVTGGAVAGGLFGTAPDLGVLEDGDPAHTMDYRALYQQVLHSWFGIEENRFSSFANRDLNQLLG